MGRTMNGTATAEARVFDFPPREQVDEGDEQQLSFVDARLIDLKAKTMAPSTYKPYWNATMVSAWCAVVGAVILILGSIAGLYVYTRQVSIDEGIRIGEQKERDRQIQERLSKAEDDARRAAQFGAARSGQAGHEANTKTEGH